MTRLHEQQIDVPDAVVRSLVDAQFPQWSGLPLRRLPSAGAINRIDRLGDHLVVRMPFIEWGASDVANDAQVLPHLAGILPVTVPTLVERGEPGPGMPWEWGVYEYIPGRHPVPGADDDPAFVDDLARFLVALRQIPGLPEPCRSAFNAAEHDHHTRHRVEASGSAAALAAWDAAVRRDASREPASTDEVFLHGDLMPGNLMITDTPAGPRLTAVLDWSARGMGDAGLDLMVAWTCLGAQGRTRLIEVLNLTPDHIITARGFAVRKIAWELPYYRDTLPGFAANLSHALGELERELE